MIKKIIGWLMLVLTTVSLSIVVGINGNYIFHKKDWYTKQQVEEKVDEAYKEGLDVNKNGDILALATEYKLKYDESKAQAENLEKELEAEKLKNSLLSENVESLTITKESAEAEVTRLNNIVLDNERTIASKENEISNLQKDVETLENTKTYNETLIASKQSQIVELQDEILQLQSLETSKDSDISLLKNQISTLKNDISVLETENANKDNQIVSLTSQISNLQSLNSQLQATNELNLQTINNLNDQIKSLNTQITDMTLQLQNNSSNVSALNNKIAELEKSISYYEQYIANLENDDKIAVTFEFNNSVYNIQIVNKNGTCSVVDPTSTDYVIFNYWTVDGERVDLKTKTFSSNTKVVADVTYKYDVKFMVDEAVYNSQIVTENGYATLPTNPTKEGYEFDGWTKNGVDIIDPVTDPITQNTTYTAKFTKLHTVTFMYADSIKETQKVRNGNYPSNVAVNSTTYKLFNGWKLNGIIVDVSTQKIVADTVFVADITYCYNVMFCLNKGDSVAYSYFVIAYNNYLTELPPIPTKEEYEFDGWTRNGIDIIDPTTIKITTDTFFYAKFTKLHTVTFVSNNEAIETKTVRDGEKTTSVSVVGTDYKVFNGWKLNDTIVNVAETTITADTTFVADWTYRYDVRFMVEETVYNSQIISENGYPTLPADPTKEGYRFDVWTKNGVDIVDPSTDPITQNTTYTAVFIEQKTISIYDNSSMPYTLLYKYQVDYGSQIGEVPYEAPVKEGYEFDGWQVNVSYFTNEDIDSTYVVESDITLYPKYKQVVFNVSVYDNNVCLYSEKVNKGDSVDLSSITPTGHSGYVFAKWVNNTGSYYETSKFEQISNVSHDYYFVANYCKFGSGKYVLKEDSSYYLQFNLNSSNDIYYYMSGSNPNISYINDGTFDFANGTFICDLSGSSLVFKIEGTFDSQNNTWTFVDTYNSTQKTYIYVFSEFNFSSNSGAYFKTFEEKQEDGNSDIGVGNKDSSDDGSLDDYQR